MKSYSVCFIMLSIIYDALLRATVVCIAYTYTYIYTCTYTFLLPTPPLILSITFSDITNNNNCFISHQWVGVLCVVCCVLCAVRCVLCVVCCALCAVRCVLCVVV
eukprot:GHVQ01000527.1.p2 GENE.GHVQ01000527.1~~GHVQ01000527.1.p2  ORF type:complete len:105 (-),score=13.10 GHVQ01000527.1:483-797(-)